MGIATQDPELRQKFTGKPEHVVNYLFMVAEEARVHMASLGFRSINEMVGRVDCLHPDAAIQHWKADGLDLTPILAPAEKPNEDVIYLPAPLSQKIRGGERKEQTPHPRMRTEFRLR